MRLNGVAFRYARRGPWVLREVTLELGPGRIVEFSGANRAGKSTLLRLIAGILRPRRVHRRLRRRRAAYSPLVERGGRRVRLDPPPTLAA